jgi:bifunctional DNase/RNase
MTTVRIAGAERRIPPGPVPIGVPSYVVILADDAGRRALPVWVPEINPRRLPQPIEPPAGDEGAGAEAAGTVDELTARLLRAAGASVTGVDLDDLGPEMPAVARISLASPAGSRQVAARVAEGLAVAITAGAPVRVADSVMDRLAVPLPAAGPLPLPEPAAAMAALRPSGRPRYEPRNLAFADGLDGWRLGGTFTRHASHAHWQDYSSGAEQGTATLAAAVPRPAGFAFLGQEMFADDYRGATVTFSGQFRVSDVPGTGVAGRAGLFLRVVSEQGAVAPATERAVVNDPGTTIITIPADPGWVPRQVTARVPAGCDTVTFGVFLAGPGRIEMRGAELARAT